MTVEPLQHDPRTKQQIKDSLYYVLYGTLQETFAKCLENLIVKNCSLVRSLHKSFVYKGEFYTCDPERPPLKMNRLDPSLRPNMNSYLKELKELNDHELPYVMGFLTQVLNSSNSLQDYLRLLPDTLHQPIKSFIATCPCRFEAISETGVKTFLEMNEPVIEMIKIRMVKNLLL